jgi:WXXGXW repeat (2 copies)
MNPKRRILASSVFAGALVLSTTALAATNFSLQVNVGPPAPIYEVVPAPRPGYLWAHGYWDYDHGRHVWRGGHWERERHGDRWTDGSWEEKNGRWYLSRGHWEGRR